MKSLLRLISTPALILIFLALLPATAYPQSPGEVVISEIAWMGTTASYNDEWIELHNNTASPIPLTGWTLTAEDGTPDISLTLQKTALPGLPALRTLERPGSPDY